MKLSKQGAAKLMAWASNDIKGDLKDIEFEQKDFKGSVLLTVDEATDILWDLRVLYKQTYGCEWVKNEPWFDEFKTRIEQAEINHAKGDI